jgi:hypothetical protein
LKSTKKANSIENAWKSRGIGGLAELGTEGLTVSFADPAKAETARQAYTIVALDLIILSIAL